MFKYSQIIIVACKCILQEDIIAFIFDIFKQLMTCELLVSNKFTSLSFLTLPTTINNSLYPISGLL